MLTANLLLAGLLLSQTPATTPAAETTAAPTPPTPPPLPPLVATQLEAYELREALYVQTLTLARQRIDAEIAATLPGWRMDWQAKRLVPGPPAQKAQVPPAGKDHP